MNNSAQRIYLLVALVAVVCIRPVLAQDSVFELDPANTKIAFTLDATLHTVHGTFKLKSGKVNFNTATGAASGSIVVDATSGNTENDGRDRKMHKTVLESAQYPEITFAPTKVTGTVAPSGDSTVIVEGIFRLHGADHPITASVPIHVHGNIVDAKVRFIVPYVEWGLKSANTFFLHVGDEVDVEVDASGHLSAAAGHP